jgi:Protein of unknown function (DUF998)
MAIERLRRVAVQPKRNRLHNLAAYFAAGGVAVYLLFAILAYSRFPGDFSPLNNNWLSDLGNRNLNPDGADFYVWGCILAGIFLGGFFVSLFTWRATGGKVQNWLLLAVQVTGLIAAASLVMSAVYTEDQFAAHQFWSRLISGGFALVLFVSPFALHRSGRNSAVLIAIGVAGYASIVARFVFESAHWIEWPSIGLILVYVTWVGLIGMNWNRERPVAKRRTMAGTLKPEV